MKSKSIRCCIIAIVLVLISCKKNESKDVSKETSLRSQSAVLNNSCLARVNGDSLSIIYKLQNTGKEKIYMNLSSWDLINFRYDSLDASQPGEIYFPNTIWIYSGNEPGMGERPDMNILEKFPNVLEIKPAETKVIIIEYQNNKFARLNKKLQYNLKLRMSYCTEIEWEKLCEHFSFDLNNTIIASDSVVISDLHPNKFTKLIDANFLSSSILIDTLNISEYVQLMEKSVHDIIQGYHSNFKYQPQIYDTINYDSNQQLMTSKITNEILAKTSLGQLKHEIVTKLFNKYFIYNSTYNCKIGFMESKH